MKTWFEQIKEKHEDLHISWSYRDQIDQEKAFNDGASRLHYPASTHNKTDSQNKPCSRALDLFQQIDGVFVADPAFFSKLNQENASEGIKLRWGGQFKTLGDSGHFELPPDIPQP